MATITILLPRNPADTAPESILPPAIFVATQTSLHDKSGYFRSQMRAGLTIMIAPRQILQDIFDKVVKFVESDDLTAVPTEFPAIISAAYLLDIPSLITRINSMIQDMMQRRCTVFQEYFAKSLSVNPNRPNLPESSGTCGNWGASSLTEVAACDGPVKFEKVANDAISAPRAAGESSKSCPECSREFKTLHCLERHKRRHIIPVSSEVVPGKKNAKFFPCKLCGRKFPTYYFVQKHRRTCVGKADC